MNIKRSILLFIIFLILFITCGCNNVESTVECYEPADMFKRFDSIEEFENYLTTVKPGDDKGDLASLEKYYFPMMIPDGYKLYKILSGGTDIGFHYLPEKYLTDETSIRIGESEGKDIIFVSPRYENTIEDIYEQFDADNSERNNDYYVYTIANSAHIFWEQDDVVLDLSIPIEILETTKDISKFCEAELVTVK